MFGVVVISIGLMAAILTVWHGTIVRIEMVAFGLLVLVWVLWAVDRILERSVERAKRETGQNREWRR
ncbi:hypothetical protein ACFO5R_17525 [Halosolutus amylolyticus]|uniref:Uncharacterized protein n=1 Tax=Halosolutus amylolyticus TaxID=2932267 RepID=A0ABD5PT21_9EURY|nr:hypothetical protein [Halosolutus amylolyticus]